MNPSDLGLPLPSWRPGQFSFIEDIAACDSPHQLLIAPTGFGKSGTYVGLHRYTGWRTVILTATRSLQDQLMREFASPLGLVDVRGQSNYECIAAKGGADLGLGTFFRANRYYTVRDAPCTRGVRCPLKDGGCLYYDAIRTAAASDVFVTNYDFWMRNQQRMGKVDLLVMDEAHQAPQEMADFMSFRLTRDQRRLFSKSMPEGDTVDTWQAWAEWAAESLKAHLGPDAKLEMVDLHRDIQRMADILGYGEWVIEHTEKGGVDFDCVDSAQFGKAFLWGRAERTLLVSATVNGMTAAALGMAAEGVKVWEAKSGFPVERRPVYAVNGAVRLNFRSMEGEKRMWAALIDRIVRERPDRKGIIHTTSFERARYLCANSALKGRLLLNDSSSTALTVERFRRSSPASGLVLVSPSVTTGWDFPMQDCEYQIIAKIPFPDLRSKAAKVVNSRNKEWSGYQAAQAIVQSSGRGMRSENDSCETFVVDGNFDWWYGQNKKFIPKWWQEAVRWVELSALPKPLPKL